MGMFAPPIATTSARAYGIREPHRSEDADQPAVGDYVAGSKRSEQGSRAGSKEAKSDTNCEQVGSSLLGKKKNRNI